MKAWTFIVSAFLISTTLSNLVYARKRCTNFSPTPCCEKGNPLTIHCGRGGQRCPPNYDCNIHVTDRWAVCCPSSKPAPCTNSSPTPCCEKGNPLTIHCGRGGQRCPGNYFCNIHVTDRWAVCCPLSKPTTCTNSSPTPCCEKGNPLTIHCGRGGQRCPGNYFCNIHVADRWAVCCPLRKPTSCTPFSPTPCCRKGNPLAQHCGRGGRRCPRNYYCNTHVTDKWAVCCPSKKHGCRKEKKDLSYRKPSA